MTNLETHKPNPVLRRVAFLGNFGFIVFPAGAVALLAVPAVLIYQLLGWLDSGRWPPLSFADGLGWFGLALPRFETQAVQLASEKLLESPLVLVLLVGVGGTLFLYARFSKWLERHCEPEKVERELGPG